MKVTRGTAWYSASRASSPVRSVMSASATAAWYIDMWVKAPLPVMSPIAQSLSPARIRASVSTARACGSSPTASSPRSAMLGRRPAATSSRSERSSTAVPPASVSETVNRPSAWRTEPIDAPAMHLDAVGRHRARDHLGGLRLLERQDARRRLDER